MGYFTNVTPQRSPIDAGSRLLTESIQRRLMAAQAQGQENENPYIARLRDAEAKSKNTYANLMGSQFMAKLLENDPAFAKLPASAKTAIMNNLTATSQTMPNASFEGQTPPVGNVKQPGLMESIYNKLFGQQQAQQSQEAAPQAQPNKMRLAQAIQQEQEKPFKTPRWKNGKLVTDEEFMPPETPIQEGSMQEEAAPPQAQPSPEDNSPDAILERGQKWINQQEKTKAQAKEAGTRRDKEIGGLEADYKGYANKKYVYDNIKNDLMSPILESVRNEPLMGSKEMAWFAKEGTPEQQQMIGKFIADTNQAITSSIQEFGSRMTDKDLALLQSMKITPSDTLDAARGKFESLASYNEYMTNKSKMASDFMSQNPNMSQSKALDMADKKLAGDNIRERLHDELNPIIVEDNGKRYKKTKGGWVQI